MKEDNDRPSGKRIWPWVTGFIAAAGALFLRGLTEKKVREEEEHLAAAAEETLTTPEERTYAAAPHVWALPPSHHTEEAEPPAEEWADRRLPLSQTWERLARDPVPERAGWLYTFGAAVAALTIIQIVTGILLLLYYVPSFDGAFESVQYIQFVAPMGWLIRDIHWWNMVMLLLLIGVHMARTFFSAAYKKPRELIWVLGVLLLILMVALAFTGQSLRGDQAAYWQLVVAAHIAQYVPLIGGWLRDQMLGGHIVGQATITRYFFAHIWVLPGMLLVVIGAHIWLIIVQGQFGSWLNYDPTYEDKRPLRRENVESMRKLERELANPKSHKHAKPLRTTWFIPYHLSKETVVAVGAFAIVFIVSFFVPAPLEAKADPAVFAYLPEPMWYFYFEDQFFVFTPQWMISVSTTWVPIIVFVLLFLLPFLDRAPKYAPSERPGAMAIGLFALLGVFILSLLAVGRIYNYRLLIPGA